MGSYIPPTSGVVINSAPFELAARIRELTSLIFILGSDFEFVWIHATFKFDITFTVMSDLGQVRYLIFHFDLGPLIHQTRLFLCHQ